MDKLRVVMVDDHVLMRKGLASLLTNQGWVEIVGEADNGQDGVTLVRELKPDIVLMDIHMPILDGLEATRIITREVPGVKVIILSMADNDHDLFEAMKIGAQGYLLKNADPKELLDALRALSSGEVAFSRSIASKILHEFSSLIKKGSEAVKNPLTAREMEILALVAKGATNKEVASTLTISESTVKNHLRRILEKLHVQNRTQLVSYAIREGIIRTPME